MYVEGGTRRQKISGNIALLMCCADRRSRKTSSPMFYDIQSCITKGAYGELNHIARSRGEVLDAEYQRLVETLLTSGHPHIYQAIADAMEQ
jgi:hypothetical protein